MNTKGMIVAIVTAMLVMTMFASSAMAIEVDGIASLGEWNMDDKLCDDGFDADGMDDTDSTGYNITSAWARIEDDGRIYFRIDVENVPGDADSDGFPDGWSLDGDCPNLEPDPDPTGVGGPCPYEIYAIDIDTDGDLFADFFLRYCNNGVQLYESDGLTIVAGADVGAEHEQIVELSVGTTDCNLDPTYYCIRAMADTDCWGNEDRTKWVCRIDDPPQAECSFTRTSCRQGTLSGTGSSDDGTIVEYAWDFYDDGTYDVITDHDENIPYDIVGTHDVRLMVTDDLGQTDNCTQTVTLTCGPIAVAKADGSDGPVVLPPSGKLVMFCGDESYHPDADNDAYIESYHWTILGVDRFTECVEVFISGPTTASLTVVDNFDCEHTDTVTLRVPIHKPPSDVPILTPTGMFALIGMLCIVGAGMILTKGRRS